MIVGVVKEMVGDSGDSRRISLAKCCVKACIVLDVVFSSFSDEAVEIKCLTDVQLSTIQVNDQFYSDNPLHLCK